MDRTEVRDLRNGTYSLNYRASKAGEYIISIYCKNVPLNGRYDGLFCLPLMMLPSMFQKPSLNSQTLSSPYRMLIHAGPTDPLASVVQGPGLFRGIAGLPAYFTLDAR